MPSAAPLQLTQWWGALRGAGGRGRKKVLVPECGWVGRVDPAQDQRPLPLKPDLRGPAARAGGSRDLGVSPSPGHCPPGGRPHRPRPSWSETHLCCSEEPGCGARQDTWGWAGPRAQGRGELGTTPPPMSPCALGPGSSPTGAPHAAACAHQCARGRTVPGPAHPPPPVLSVPIKSRTVGAAWPCPSQVTGRTGGES